MFLLCTIFLMNTLEGIPFEKRRPVDTLKVSVSLWMLLVLHVQRTRNQLPFQSGTGTILGHVCGLLGIIGGD